MLVIGAKKTNKKIEIAFIIQILLYNFDKLNADTFLLVQKY